MSINITITLIVTILVALAGIYLGGKKGFAKSVSGFIALVVTLFMLKIILRIYNAYTNGRTMDLIIAVVTLVVLGVVYGILKIVLKSAKAIASLPVIAIIDKLLGAVLGFLAVIAVYHVVITASRLGYFGIVGQSFLQDMNSNQWLTFIASHDVIEIVLTWKKALLG